MKKIIMFMTIFILAVSSGLADTIYGTGKRVYYDCINATSPGEPLCTTGNFSCRDSSGNTDGEGNMINVELGLFFITHNLTTDTYSCTIGCRCTGAFNYTIGLDVRTVPLIATDNIGLNLDDTTGDYATADFENGFLTDAKVANDVQVDVVTIETSDATDQIRDSVVDDATRIDGSSVNAVEAKVDTVDGNVDLILADTGTDGVVIATNQVCDLNSTSAIDLFNIGLDLNTSLDNDNVLTAEHSVISLDINQSANVTLDEIDTRLNLSHSTGNWTGQSGTATISAADIQEIGNKTDTILNLSHDTGSWKTFVGSVTVNATQIFEENLTPFCNFNASDVPDQAGEMICVTYNQV